MITKENIEKHLTIDPLVWVFTKYTEDKNCENKCVCYEITRTSTTKCLFFVIDKVYYKDQITYSLHLTNEITINDRNYDEVISNANSIEELMPIANNYIVDLICNSLDI